MKNTIPFLIIFTLLLIIGQYFFLPEWYRESEINISGWMIMVSVAVGVLGSILMLNWLIKKFLSGKPFDIFGLSASANFGSKAGAYLCVIVSYPFALFIGFVAGGSLGGGIGEHTGLDSAGIILGIGVGVFIITSVISIVALIIGIIIGGVTEKLVKSLH
jgi:hypothetical protein